MSLFVVEFGFKTNHLACLVRAFMYLTAFLLPFPLMVVQAVAMALTVQLNVFVLRLETEQI